jgi:hypothetical protein
MPRTEIPDERRSSKKQQVADCQDQFTNYFDLKKSEGWSWAAVLAAFSGPAGPVSWQGR